MSSINLHLLSDKIQHWGNQLGFSQIGISDIDLSSHESALQNWLDNKYHGDMDYMERHGMMRARPDELEIGAVRAISVRLNYLPTDAKFSKAIVASTSVALSLNPFISRNKVPIVNAVLLFPSINGWFFAIPKL